MQNIKKQLYDKKNRTVTEKITRNFTISKINRGGRKWLYCAKEIIKRIETFAPKHLAEQWDNVGLTVGDKNKQIKKKF